jgi:hypothetical protein
MLVPFNVFLFFLYLATFTVFIFFYYPAIRQSGLLKLKKFTEIMLLVFGCAVFFSRFVPADMIYKLPLRVLLVLGGAEYATPLVIMVMVFFVYVAINIHKEEKPKLLTSAWLAIALLNIGDILLNAYYYNTWSSPDVSENASSVDIAMEHVLVQISYLYQMIYPACWVIVSCISLIKIIKERHKEALPTPS